MIYTDHSKQSRGLDFLVMRCDACHEAQYRARKITLCHPMYDHFQQNAGKRGWTTSILGFHICPTCAEKGV